MPLTLVTGPANADKAAVVLARVRELAAGGERPILVVPTPEDVSGYRAELAGDGLLLGVAVERFEGLMSVVADRAGVLPRPASELVREHVARAAVAACDLGPTARSAATPGFAGALVALAGELAGHGVGTGRFVAAMRSWAQAEPARRAYAEDLGRLVAAYRDRLERLGRLDPADADRAALDVIRREPRRWEATPVAFYGFDDFTPAQLDAIETLAVHGVAPVIVSLPFEPGRAVFAARAEVHARLGELAAERIEMPASDAAYDADARAALHGLERGLLVPGAPPAPAGDSFELLEGGGPRAELELVAERVRRLIASGTPPDAIVIAARDADAAAPLIEAVLREADIPFALSREVPLAHTALGAGVLGLLRGALPGGTASDLVRFLRTPGFIKQPSLIDELERRIRTRGLRSADAARAAWDEFAPFPLDPVARVTRAAGRGTAALCTELGLEAARLLAAPQRPAGAGAGLARDLTADEARDADALRAVQRALGELGRLADRAAPLAPGPHELAAALAALRVRTGTPPGPGRVAVTSPLAIRARRRVEALFLCRLESETFPRPGTPEPFLGDDERRAINTAGGLRLAGHEYPPSAEQYLLYAAVSRPTRRLVLSWHSGDDDGEALVRSPFVDDVLRCFADPPAPRNRRLGSLAWTADADVSPRQRSLGERARAGTSVPAQVRAEPRSAIGMLTSPVVLGRLAERDAWSATEIETFAHCPVDWFAERFLRPETLDPDNVHMARGIAAHAALQTTFEALDAPLTSANLEDAERLLGPALLAALSERPIAVDPRRDLAERHRTEADLLRYLAHAADAGSAFLPAHFELGFGVPGAEHPVVDLGDGLRLRGKIDRVDVSADGTQAIIVDYKGRTPRAGWAGWVEEGSLQAGLYALVLEHLLPGVEVVGALLQPIGAEENKLGARGFLLERADPGRGDVRGDDRVSAGERDSLLEDVRAAATRAIAEIRQGRLGPRPGSCGYRDEGCANPTICRCVT